MADPIDVMFLVLFVLLFGGLGISNFVEAKNQQDQTVGRPFFGLLFIVIAIGLIIYKLATR
jgi:hypothetical protein